MLALRILPQNLKVILFGPYLTCLNKSYLFDLKNLLYSVYIYTIYFSMVSERPTNIRFLFPFVF
nr:MAG TPA: hypothetical protein [Bacteriophage sp.]